MSLPVPPGPQPEVRQRRGASNWSAWPLVGFSLAILVGVLILTSGWNPFSWKTTSTSGQQEPPPEYPDTSIKGLTTLLSQDALRDEVVANGDERQRRLRATLRDAMRWTVGDFTPDQHHQCLVSLGDNFGRDYKSFSMDVEIRVEFGLELRDLDAFLVSDEDSKSGPVSRKVTAKLPEIRNHTATLDLDNPKATESLLLVCRIGSENLNLQGLSAGSYGLTLTKRD